MLVTAYPIMYVWTWSPNMVFIEVSFVLAAETIELLSKVTEVKLLQPSYLQLVVCQSILFKTVEKWLRRFCRWWKRWRINTFNFSKPQKHKNVQFFSWLMWIVSSIVIQNCDSLSQLYIEDIQVLICKFGGYDYTILLRYARVIMSRGWNYELLSNALPLLMYKKIVLSGNNFGQ